MLAMSSTTIIYKAFDDMGLRQQKFASMVMSVLILEDILAIVMMVMLSAIAGGNNPDGEQMFTSVLRIGFFLVLWFIVGIFAIPLFLRSVRKFINGETLLIVSLGLCLVWTGGLSLDCVWLHLCRCHARLYEWYAQYPP